MTKKLTLKIPPPVVAMIVGFIIWGLSRNFPFQTIDSELRQMLSLAILTMAIAIDVWALISFRRVKTTIDPRYPHKTTSIVSHGIYAYTRNPMYLGLSLILTALSVYLGTVIGLLAVIGFVFYINIFQIMAEEKVLEQQFGDAYLKYKNNVRRWV